MMGKGMPRRALLITLHSYHLSWFHLTSAGPTPSNSLSTSVVVSTVYLTGPFSTTMSRLPAPENPIVDHDHVDPAHSNLDYKDGDGSADSIPKKSKGMVLISSIGANEPIVTRRELWAYYMYYNGDNVRPHSHNLSKCVGLC